MRNFKNIFRIEGCDLNTSLKVSNCHSLTFTFKSNWQDLLKSFTFYHLYWKQSQSISKSQLILCLWIATFDSGIFLIVFCLLKHLKASFLCQFIWSYFFSKLLVKFRLWMLFFGWWVFIVVNLNLGFHSL